MFRPVSWTALLAAGLLFGACSSSTSSGTSAGTDSSSGFDIPISDAKLDAGSDAAAGDGSGGKDSASDAGDTPGGQDSTDSKVDDVAADAVDAGDVSPDLAEVDIAGLDAADAEDAADVVDAADADVPDINWDALDDMAGYDAAVDTAEVDVPPSDVADGTDDADVPPPAPVFAPLGTDLKVNQNTDGTVNPFVSPARNGQFYVSWVQKPGNLMLSWVNPNATVALAPLQVNTVAGEVYYWGGQSVISDTDGNFYAVWEGKSNVMFAQSTTGKNFLPAQNIVSTSENGLYPSIATDKPNHVRVAWSGLASGQYDPFTSANDAATSGGKWSTAVQVVKTKGQDDSVAVAIAPDGTIWVVWESFDGDLFAASSTDGGATFGAAVQVNDVAGKASVGIGTFAVVAPDGTLWVAWSDRRTDSEGDLYVDHAAPGKGFGVDEMMADSTSRYQEDPSLVVGKTGKCYGVVYAVWQDFRSNKNYDIYGTRSLGAGKGWAKNEVVHPSTAGDQMNPALAVDPACKVGVAWRDSATNPDFDVRTTFYSW
ncbi:MAG: hypothetical protein HY902_18790 [Deltaproteobacteria bacterium]|nr:hypothetical protein [Deltaproteobacteria bacterium]